MSTITAERLALPTRGRTRWTERETVVLRSALASGRDLHDVAAHLGRTIVAVRAKSKRLAHPALNRPWGAERRAQLVELVAMHTPWPRISAIMGNSASYLQDRLTEAGVSRRTVNGYTLAATSRLMGVDSHAVAWWIREGWLRGKRTRIQYGHGRLTVVQHDALLSFLADGRYWPVWRAEAITDLALREWALETRGGAEFLTTGQVADLLGVTHYRINQLVRQGRIRGVKLGPCWWIRREDAIYPEWRPRPRRNPISDAERAYIREHYGRIPATEIARALGCTATTVDKHARRMGLAQVGRGHWKRVAAGRSS